MLSLKLITADPSLGRLDYGSLPDQTLMELLIEGMADKQKKFLQDDKGNFKDACGWYMHKCTDDRVTHIYFYEREMSWKQFPFQFIPPLVESFFVTLSSVRGTLDTAVLPPKLRMFDVSENKLEGQLNFKAFPRELTEISIAWNSFHGSCALGDLPDSLVDFTATQNKFSGEISLNHLPSAMKTLVLNRNSLMGPVHIYKLPEAMRVIDLGHNALSGVFRLMECPPDLDYVSVDANPLDGTVVLLCRAEEMRFELNFDNIKAVVDEEGNTHPLQEDILKANDYARLSDSE